MQVDLIAQDVLLLQPLLTAGAMEDLTAYRADIPASAIPSLAQIGTLRRGDLFYALSAQRADRLL